MVGDPGRSYLDQLIPLADALLQLLLLVLQDVTRVLLPLQLLWGEEEEEEEEEVQHRGGCSPSQQG